MLTQHNEVKSFPTCLNMEADDYISLKNIYKFYDYDEAVT